MNYPNQLKIMRMLVDLQLIHNADIKGSLDTAWGVAINKHKKGDTAATVPDPTDPKSRENLTLAPIGEDISRIRYWVVDGKRKFLFATLDCGVSIDILHAATHSTRAKLQSLSSDVMSTESPRVWTQSNPWKMAATFKTVSSTKEEYAALIRNLQAVLPETEANEKRTRSAQAHAALIQILEDRTEAVYREEAVRKFRF